MNRSFATACVLCCTLAFAAYGATRAPEAWKVIGSDRQHYAVDGSGDATGDSGATVTVTRRDADPAKFGGSLSVLDAATYRGDTLALSADLDTGNAERGAEIWLRADDAAGKMVAFANSQRMPVLGTASGVHREVRIDVPATATRVLFGTILQGNGEVVARHLRLMVAGKSNAVAVAPEAVLDAAIQIVRTRGLHARDVDWQELIPALHAMGKDAKSTADVYPTIRFLLAKLGDHHSFLMVPGDVHQDRTQGGATSPSTVELQRARIGYIEMPGYSGMNADAQRAFVGNMVDAIGKLAPQVRCGWIVDLRGDTGGNMYPMLAGLRPLLGDGKLGGFRDADGRMGTFAASSPFDPAAPAGPALEHAPVAVLYGPHTASSGEVVAVAFRGRPGTRSFGRPTAGLSTANTGFDLPDGSRLFLTTAVDVDRTGQAYGDKLQPDVLTTASDAEGDAALAVAQAWLEQKPDCHP
ncbi:S41 family peptidase [Rhodanobacter hydrolyticus]|uniref:S41 family peptidase n=1 Tax=Rhodanobacter hydrolyticus TaxID=2250595 RepID=A0ABW8J305_9GAMM